MLKGGLIPKDSSLPTAGVSLTPVAVRRISIERIAFWQEVSLPGFWRDQ